MASPLQQFEIKPLIEIRIPGFVGYDLSFTNSALFMIIAVAVAVLFFQMAMAPRAMVPGRLQALAESVHDFVFNLVETNAGHEARRYFPFVFTLFLVVLLGNLLGMVPFAFTYTSHIIVTITLALLVFLVVNVIAISRHGLHFFSYFLPEGTPIAMAPLVIVIEIISYLARPLALSIRLFANMMAGHTMLKIFAGFVVSLSSFYVLPSILPLGFITVLIGFEFLVALLQAYVFALLTCIYLHDAIHLH